MSGIVKRETDMHFYDFLFKYRRPFSYMCETWHKKKYIYYVIAFRENHYFTYISEIETTA